MVCLSVITSYPPSLPALFCTLLFSATTILATSLLLRLYSPRTPESVRVHRRLGVVSALALGMLAAGGCVAFGPAQLDREVAYACMWLCVAGLGRCLGMHLLADTPAAPHQK